MKNLIYSLSCLAIVSCNTKNADNKADIFLMDTSDSRYKVGQVWKYKTRPVEPKSTLTIVKVDSSNIGVIVHIYVDKLKIKTAGDGTDYSEQITHSPFSEVALDSSVTELISTTQSLPDYKEGYTEWSRSFLTGDAGVFSIPVNQSVEYMEQTILKGALTN